MHCSLHLNTICTIVHVHFAHRISLCIILLHIYWYIMYCAVVHIVLIISLAGRKHIESDNMGGTGDPPPLWPLLLIGIQLALLIGSLLLCHCFKSIECFCWAQVLNPNVIFLDCKYICVSSYQLYYMIQKSLFYTKTQTPFVKQRSTEL